MKRSTVAFLLGITLICTFILPTVQFSASASSDPEGIFRCALGWGTLKHKFTYSIFNGGFSPSIKCNGYVDDVKTGFTDGNGYVTFRCILNFSDTTNKYRAEGIYWLAAWDVMDDWRFIGNVSYWWDRNDDTYSVNLDLYDNKQFTPDEEREYKLLFYTNGKVYGWLKEYGWGDWDNGYVTVQSRAGAPYQQEIHITSAHNDIPGVSRIGKPFTVLGYIDADKEAGRPVSDTEVCIVLRTERGFGSQTHNVFTDSNGNFSLTSTITHPLGNGTLNIFAYDSAKNESYIVDPDGDIWQKKLRPAHPGGYVGLFVVPHSYNLTIPGLPIVYTVGVTSNNYEGLVDLTVSGLPTGITADFDQPSVYIGVNETRLLTWFTISVVGNPPLGWQPFNITGTYGGNSTVFTCPLVVKPGVETFNEKYLHIYGPCNTSGHPMITQNQVYVNLNNPFNDTVSVDWELQRGGTVISGDTTLCDPGMQSIPVQIIDWQTAGNHTWTLTETWYAVPTPNDPTTPSPGTSPCGGARELSSLVCDANWDTKIDLVDIFSCLILNYGLDTTSGNWWIATNPAVKADVNCDGKIDMADIFWAIIQFGKNV